MTKPNPELRIDAPAAARSIRRVMAQLESPGNPARRRLEDLGVDTSGLGRASSRERGYATHPLGAAALRPLQEIAQHTEALRAIIGDDADEVATSALAWARRMSTETVLYIPPGEALSLAYRLSAEGRSPSEVKRRFRCDQWEDLELEDVISGEAFHATLERLLARALGRQDGADSLGDSGPQPRQEEP